MGRGRVEQVDVVIVGGGLSGLAAADLLHQRSLAGRSSASFVVLEAGDRLGGRVLTAEAPGHFGWLDMGGAFFAVTQHHVMRMVDRFGLVIDQTYLPQGKSWRFQLESGEVLELRSDDPTSYPGGLHTLEALAVLDRLTCHVRSSLTEPEVSLRAELFDQWSVADFIANYAMFSPQGEPMHDHTRQAFTVSVRSGFSAEPHQISFLYLLHYAARTGSYAMLADILGGPLSAEGTRLAYGAGDLVAALHGALPRGAVRMGEAVQRITQGKEGCTVTTRDGTYTCGRVIVATAPRDASQGIVFDPPLAATPGAEPAGARRETLTGAAFMGRTIKGFLLYRTPWWRDVGDGHTGNTMATHADIDRFPLDWALDHVWDPPEPDPARPVPPHPNALMTFIVGEAANRWAGRSREERRDALCRQLADIYGTRAAIDELLPDTPAQPSYLEHDFHGVGRFGGCPSALLPPQVFAGVPGALAAPVGRVHFAGSESAVQWAGYMNGALQSGQRAAAEVLTQGVR
ncbi:MAG: FAD-dependent oxidoreductase [Alphaproteobacteria bacterium]|nr:FAD-dependent oxidoreductase [Alphaproteobacteria bacterium]